MSEFNSDGFESARIANLLQAWADQEQSRMWECRVQGAECWSCNMSPAPKIFRAMCCGPSWMRVGVSSLSPSEQQLALCPSTRQTRSRVSPRAGAGAHWGCSSGPSASPACSAIMWYFLRLSSLPDRSMPRCRSSLFLPLHVALQARAFIIIIYSRVLFHIWVTFGLYTVSFLSTLARATSVLERKFPGRPAVKFPFSVNPLSALNPCSGQSIVAPTVVECSKRKYDCRS